MYNKNCRTGSEQFIGHVQGMKWSAVDFQLWYCCTVKKWNVVVKPFCIKIQKRELLKWENIYTRILCVGIFNIVLWEF
jgi:hypothetical protein